MKAAAGQRGGRMYLLCPFSTLWQVLTRLLLTGILPLACYTGCAALHAQYSETKAKRLTHEGRTLYRRGQYVEALREHERALQLYTDVLGERHPDTLQSMNEVGLIYNRIGRSAEALAIFEKLLKLRLEVTGEHDP